MSTQYQFLSKIIGQAEAVQQLASTLESGRMPHALLFSGPEGVGKYFTARMLACEFLGLDQERLELARAGTHPDLHLIVDDPTKKQLAVQDVRELLEDLSLRPYYGGSKVAIIQEAHRLSPAASNALLLSLEEPPENTYFILVSSAPHRMLPTIISRCASTRFSALSDAALEQILKAPPFSLKLDAMLYAETLGDSLELLKSSKWLDPLTLNISDDALFAEALENIGNHYRKLKTRIQEALEPNSAAYPRALDLSAEIAAAKDPVFDSVFWHFVRSELRSRLHSSNDKTATLWASALEDSIEAEKMIVERNANRELQVLSFLIRSAEMQAGV